MHTQITVHLMCRYNQGYTKVTTTSKRLRRVLRNGSMACRAASLSVALTQTRTSTIP